MGYFIVALIIFIGSLRQRSNIVTFFTALYMWILIAFNVGTTDFYAFEEMYYNAYASRYSHHEPGFLLICKIMSSLGFNYLHFRMVIALLVVMLVVSGMKYFTTHINYALVLYIMFPFPSAVAGLRFSVGSALIVFGMKYLFMRGKKAAIKYVSLVLLSALFHYSMLFFLLFLIVKFIHGNMLKTAVIVPAVVGSMLLFLQSGLAFRFADSVLHSEKAKTWLNPVNFRNHFSPYYGVFFALLAGVIFIMYLSLSGIEKERKLLGDKLISEEDVEKMISIEILSMIGIMLAYLSEVVFMRIVFVSLPIAYAFLSEGYVEYAGMPNQLRWQSRVVKSIMLVYTLIMLLIHGYWINLGLIQVYQSNMIFDFIDL